MRLTTLVERLPSTSQLPGRPLVRQHYYGAWLVLVVALVFGLGGYAVKPEIGLLSRAIGSTGSVNYLGVNYRVYHVAAEHALSGESFYGVSPPDTVGGYRYLYPPVSVVVFYSFTLVDWTTGYVFMTAGSVLAGALGSILSVQYVEEMGHSLGWIDITLVFALFTLSIHVSATIYFGNINILLGVALAVGFWALARGRETLAGALFVIPALFKLFPALVGLWLLRDRQWRATGVAIAIGIAGLVAGVFLFGLGPTVYYFTHVLGQRSDTGAFVGGYPIDSTCYLTVQRPLSHLIWGIWPDAPSAVLPLSSIILCAGVLGYFYRDISTPRRRVIAMFVTVTMALVVVPSFRLYVPLLFLPFVVLLYSWNAWTIDRVVFLFGGLLVSIPARPKHVVAAAESLPAPVSEPLLIAGTVATVQLYALALMLAGCAWHLSTVQDSTCVTLQ